MSLKNQLQRPVFQISDGTGVTVEAFSHSLLALFELKFDQIRVPFIDSKPKACELVKTINKAGQKAGCRPLVFTTLIDDHLRSIIKSSEAMVIDLFETFIVPLEAELGTVSVPKIGRARQSTGTEAYKNRIAAIHFSLLHDDGQTHSNLEGSDLILVGVSRSGKTPTALYLAVQYGLKAANYPLIPEDFERGTLPEVLRPFLHKVFGLSIDPTRLAEVRRERRSGGHYASLSNCYYEVQAAETMMRQEGIKFFSSTHKSIEEIAAAILDAIQRCR